MLIWGVVWWRSRVAGALLRPASPLWISVNFSPSPPPPRRCDSRQQQGPAPADLPGQTWRCGCFCPRSSASLPPVCRLHAGRLPAEDRRSPRRWVLMLRAWNRRCVISPSSSDGEALRACGTSTRVPIRGDCNWNGCLLSRSDRKTFTRRFFQNTLDALYPSLPHAHTHARSLAQLHTCPFWWGSALALGRSRADAHTQKEFHSCASWSLPQGCFISVPAGWKEQKLFI